MRDGPEPIGSLVAGGGPAGLFAAARLAGLLAAAPRDHPAAPILLLEAGPRPGRKLLVSGSGRCNLAHDSPVPELLARYGGGVKPGAAGRFLKRALHALDTEALLDWFRARGLSFVTEASGKIFPESGKAGDILKALLAELARHGVALETQAPLRSLSKRADGLFAFERLGADGAPRPGLARRVLLATGGLTWPVTGSRGEGFALARSLGHGIVETRAALAPLVVARWRLAGLSGLSFRDAGLALRRGGRVLQRRRGDLLITHEGLSGPLVLDASRDFHVGDLLEIRFAPLAGGEEGEAAATFEAGLDALAASNPRGLVRLGLSSLGLPRSLAAFLCEEAGLAEGALLADLPRAARRRLAGLAAAFPVEVEAPGDPEVGMVTAGGVDLAEVDPATMESRLVSGLYFAGEVLDVDGDTGGYNLHAAFATAALAAESLYASTRGASPAARERSN